jgi:hypothetical protein
MKKLIIDRTETIDYKNNNVRNLICFWYKNKHPMILLQIGFEKWIWIDLLSSCLLDENDARVTSTIPTYSSPESAIKKLLNRDIEVFEVKDLEELLTLKK